MALPPAAASRGLTLVALPLALLAAGTRAAPAQGLTVELRAGVVASSPLAEDAVLERGTLDTLVTTHPVTLRAALAPMVGLAARTRVASRWDVEAAAGWTFSELQAEESGGTRGLHGLGVAHATLALRYAPTERFYVRGGLGGIRYQAEPDGIFAEGNEVKPVFEVGGGVAWRRGRMRLAVDLSGQMHGFGTVALRREGGVDGRVFRAALQAALTLREGSR